MLEEILAYNKAFTEKKEGQPFRTDKYPDRKMAIITCMDTRLTLLLPAALGLRNGDVQIIKTAGGIVNDEFDSVVRSLIVAVYQMGVEEVLVIGHDDCGMQGLRCEHVMKYMKERGVDVRKPESEPESEPESGPKLARGRVDRNLPALNEWLAGFDCVEDSVRHSVEVLKGHPLLPKDLRVYGLVIDPDTGALRRVESC